MGNELITANMGVTEMFATMSEGNPEVISIVMSMLNDPTLSRYILLCDSLNIRGSRLYMFHTNCCGHNNEKFKRTLTMVKRGIYTEEEINTCLNLPFALPFIDDTIVIDGVPPYGEAFDENHPKWREFCLRNKQAFLEKLTRVKEQTTPKM